MCLIPDIENIIFNYLTPYEYFQLIDEKIFTTKKYIVLQKDTEITLTDNLKNILIPEIENLIKEIDDIKSNNLETNELLLLMLNTKSESMIQKENLFKKFGKMVVNHVIKISNAFKICNIDTTNMILPSEILNLDDLENYIQTNQPSPLLCFCYYCSIKSQECKQFFSGGRTYQF